MFTELFVQGLSRITSSAQIALLSALCLAGAGHVWAQSSAPVVTPSAAPKGAPAAASTVADESRGQRAGQDGSAEIVLKFDQAAAKLLFSGQYDGEAIDGKFQRFSGTLKMPAARPLEMRFDVQVDVASLDTEYAERDDTLKSADWFAVEQFPTARFASNAACTGSYDLQCAGELTMRGKTLPIVLKVERISASGGAPERIRGVVELSRKAFGIGSGEWDDMGVIGENVSVRFEIPVADR